MNFPEDYFISPSRTELNNKYIIEEINEKVKEAIIELDKNKDKNFIYVRSTCYFLFVHKCEDDKEYMIVVVPSKYYSCITSNDKLIKQGILSKTLKDAQVGDIILASNNKKYRIIESMNGGSVDILDLETFKIVEGWMKGHFFNNILPNKLRIIDNEENICPIEIVKE